MRNRLLGIYLFIRLLPLMVRASIIDPIRYRRTFHV